MNKKNKVDCFVVSYAGEYSVKKLNLELLVNNPVVYKKKNYIHFNLDNTGTAGTNKQVIHLLIESKNVESK